MSDRAQVLIEYIRKEKNMSYTGAYKYLKERPDMLKDANISEKLFEKYDLSKVRGRVGYKKMLFMRLIDRCEYGIQFRSILQQLTDTVKEKAMTTELVNNPVPEMINLFIMEHMKYEIEVCHGKYKDKDDKTKLLKAELRIYKSYEKLFDSVFWDALLWDDDESQSIPLMNALDLYLKKNRDRSFNGGGQKAQWSSLYDEKATEIRRALGVKKNLSFNHGVSKGKKKVIPKKRPSQFGSTNTTTAGASALQQKASRICIYFNRPQGCRDGQNCPYDHICYGCLAGGHGICNCWQQMDRMENKFISRLTRMKNYTITAPNGRTFSNNKSRYAAPTASAAKSDSQELANGLLLRDGVVYTQLTGPPPYKKQKTGK